MPRFPIGELKYRNGYQRFVERPRWSDAERSRHEWSTRAFCAVSQETNLLTLA